MRVLYIMHCKLQPLVTKCNRAPPRSTKAIRRLAFAAVGSILALGALQAPAVAEPLPKGGGYFKLGPSYEIMGRRYTPQDTDDLDVTGMASWYGIEVHGRKTANGELFDMNALTAAHKTLPLPSYVYVTNLENGRKLLVRVNDRGPFIGERMIDVSDKVAKHLGFFDRGLTKVRVEYAGPAPLNGDDTRERQILAENLIEDSGTRVATAATVPSTVKTPSDTVLKAPNANTVTLASIDANELISGTAADRTRAALERPIQRSLVAPVPPVRSAKLLRTDDKPETAKPVRVARASPSRKLNSDDSLGYRPFDPCWSCLARDQ
jgi:rare lipoprotein A